MTSYPLRKVMYKPETTGRMLKWTIEIGQFEVDYKPRTAIKGHALADFILEFPPTKKWIRGGFIVIPEINREYQAKGPRTELYLMCEKRIIGMFHEVRLELITGRHNEGADKLEKLGSRHEATLLGVVPLDIQRRPNMPLHEIISIVSGLDTTWMTLILAYLKEGLLLDIKNETRRMRYKVARYVIYDRTLYRREFNVPLLKCIDGNECNYILREVHEGICGNHLGGSSLA
ncbi:uncharacterized protein LOC141721873 [Apium graveolens]|uniref:uncharacterized protein LOC141721873 n=1 Tax=Apium graveolens TaxID=4045 RepID=UPI003D7AD08C